MSDCTENSADSQQAADDFQPSLEWLIPYFMRGMGGYVYILTNPSIKGCKIGFTAINPEQRAVQLSAGTAIPTPFEVYFSTFHASARLLEKYTHMHFEKKRISLKREFFAVNPEKVAEYIKFREKTCQDQINRYQGMLRDVLAGECFVGFSDFDGGSFSMQEVQALNDISWRVRQERGLPDLNEED